RDCQREVPRRDHGRDTFALIGQAVAFPWRGLDEVGSRSGEPEDLAAVVLAEVDRFAHIGVGLVPRLAGLEHLECRELVAPLAHPLGGTEQHSRTAARWRGAPPVNL